MSTNHTFDWSADVRMPVAPSPYPLVRHTSATGAQVAAITAGQRARDYLDLLDRVGEATDYQAARALGCGVSSICSTRAMLARWLHPSGRVDRVTWPGGRTSERAYWRRATPREVTQWDEEHATTAEGTCAGE